MLRVLFFGASTMAICALLIFSASKADDDTHVAKHATQTYRVLILPICNPGFSCDPALPKQLEELFFRHKLGVSAFIKTVSHHHAKVIGTVSGWVRPRHKLKSALHVLEQSDELFALAKPMRLRDFDIIFLYTTMSGASTEMSWPSGQLIFSDAEELKPGLAYMINTPIYHKTSTRIARSAILPSTSWAKELLHAIGLSTNSTSLVCKDLELRSCTLERTPIASARPQMPTAFLRRSLNWSHQKAIKQVRENGIFTISATDTTPWAGLELILPKAVEINGGTRFDRLFIEPKTRNGFDQLFGRALRAENNDTEDSILDDALLFFGNGQNDVSSLSLITKLSNTTGNSPRKNFFASSAREQSFNVFDTSITVRVVKANAASVAIKIDGF